jgi:hypothetical protein
MRPNLAISGGFSVINRRLASKRKQGSFSAYQGYFSAVSGKIASIAGEISNIRERSELALRRFVSRFRVRSPRAVPPTTLSTISFSY